MSGKLPFMPFYGGDFYQDESVALMTYAEQGMYQRLLWHQWREGSIPGDVGELTALLREAVPDRVLACFHVRSGRRQNPRLEAVRAKHDAFSEAQSQKAKMKWEKKKRAGPMPEPCRTDAEPMLSEVRSQNQITDSVGKPTPAEPAEVEPLTGVSALQAVMGATQTHLWLGKHPDSRDAGLAKKLLRRHPAEVILQAVEGLRLLVDRGKLPPATRGQALTLTYLESPKWGINVFSAALDAYYAEEKTRSKREHTAPTGIGDELGNALKQMGAA